MVERAADDLVELVFLPQLLAQVGVLGDDLAVRERLPQLEPQLDGLERLLQVVERAELGGLDRDLERPEARDDDDDGRWGERAGALEHVHAGGAGLAEVEVGDDDLRGEAFERLHRARALVEGNDLVALRAEDFGDDLNRKQIIFHEHYFGHAGLG
jgi:hypothetical protein